MTDGDTLRVGSVAVRLKGLAAPEVAHGDDAGEPGVSRPSQRRAAESLHAGDAEENNARARLERWGRPVVAPAPGTRWPWQHAEAFRREEEPSYHGPRSARTDQELAAKIELALAVMRRRS